MNTQDEEIARHLREAAASGELAAARDYGKPFAEDDGWFETPADLRMPFRILRNAGAAPPELELFHRRARLAEAVRACADDAQRRVLQQQLSELEQHLALRLEALRESGRV